MSARDDEIDIRDELPADLDVTSAISPYEIPDNGRRRIGAVILLATAACCLGLRLIAGPDAIYVNSGFLWAAAGMGALGALHWVAGYPLQLRETDALVVASRTVGYPVGPASAQLRWRGLRSRPVWQVLVYSAEEQPLQRGLVVVDGVDGRVLEWFSEKNPENFNDYAPGATAAEDSPSLDTGGTVSEQVKAK